jgi:small subunit ribosomal protein S7e
VSTVKNKIIKKDSEATSLEQKVAQALADLETNVPELKGELRSLHFVGAKEVDINGSPRAIVLLVPVPQLKAYQKIQTRLVRELEKKFSGKHFMIIAQRRILPKETKKRPAAQLRPRSRTLTEVHRNILDELVFPSSITGKRIRAKTDGSTFMKVFLDPKDVSILESKLDTFSGVYKKLTGKNISFEFLHATHGTE